MIVFWINKLPKKRSIANIITKTLIIEPIIRTSYYA